LDFDDVCLADFSTFGDTFDFSAAAQRTLELELALDENMPRPKSNLVGFRALDDAFELKVDCLRGLASSCNCLSAFYAMCTSSTTLL
jgi:hypothetical protein